MKIKTVEEINNQIAFQRKQLKRAKAALKAAEHSGSSELIIAINVEHVNCILAGLDMLYWVLDIEDYSLKIDTWVAKNKEIMIPYTEKVKFNKTNLYGCGPITHDDVYTIEEFKECCDTGAFVDYDGYGYPVRNKLANRSILVKPSDLKSIPECATHIVWFNN